MNERQDLIVESPLGRKPIDSAGSPIGVARMDVENSYAGIGPYLQRFIDSGDKEAWKEIKRKIDYMYDHLGLALEPLDAETGLGKEMLSRLKKGLKLLFKPNLVSVRNIDPQTHGTAIGHTACTEWPFLAALMRWFHDKFDISYHQMAVGEAATVMSSAAGQYTILKAGGLPVTTEAAMEGRSEDFYGGWGFYFARKYLAETLDPQRTDNPMNGFEESVAGTYIPPGLANDKLMVYDLNRTFDDAAKGRDVDVPDGVNYRSITLHKVIVGGDPDDPEDCKAYPGCVLVNVPKLKVHSRTLFTNAIKNLGIGLYPMESTREGGFKWDYAQPHHSIPGIKFIPHQIWHPEMDFETGVPLRDAEGNYIVIRTGGICATMVDVIKAVSSRDVFMIHVVDSIEATNLEHATTGLGKLEPEGLVFAGLDPVATDLLCARYMFKNVHLEEALKTDLDDGLGGRFIQQVPMPAVDHSQIVTRDGYDSPMSRDILFPYAKERGLGDTAYYVVGKDVLEDCPLASLDGHLGWVKDGVFSELITSVMYFDVLKLPWDLQKTVIGYLESVDNLTGSELKQTFFETFDENGNGIVEYEEGGTNGNSGAILAQNGISTSITGSEKFGFLRGPFSMVARRLKWSRAEWNPAGHTIFKDAFFASICWTAYRMSKSEKEQPDLFLPGLTWGRGKWPSFDMAKHIYLGSALFGGRFPDKVMFPGLYSLAFRYADLTQNQGRYTGDIVTKPNPKALDRYISQVGSDGAAPLDFTYYVPGGMDKINGSKPPNIEMTSDPSLIFTAHFSGGSEIWPNTGN
jgi:hypothetical protein